MISSQIAQGLAISSISCVCRCIMFKSKHMITTENPMERARKKGETAFTPSRTIEHSLFDAAFRSSVSDVLIFSHFHTRIREGQTIYRVDHKK